MGEHSRSVSLDLEPSLVAPRAARSAIEDLLDASPGSFVADALLLTSELVTNAVLHTESPFTISAEFDPAMKSLRVEVADASTFVPTLPPQTSDATVGGHGLRIVAAIARRWGVLSTDRGKTIWFELVG